MQYKGTLKKMLTELNTPIQYYLDLKDNFIHMNQIIGKEIEIKHISNECKSCGMDKPIFRMGFCKNCFFTSPEANPNILHPELSKAHLGKENRDLEWEKNFELRPHIVYLAESGGLKVGVTRESQIPFRWIDQGADQAIILAKTENRYEAGMIEVELKNYFSDKTNWRKMLTSKANTFNLVEEREKAKSLIPSEFQKFYNDKSDVVKLNFPLEHSFEKVTRVNLEKGIPFRGVLIGIKGQYLIFEDYSVLNIRSNESKVVEILL